MSEPNQLCTGACARRTQEAQAQQAALEQAMAAFAQVLDPATLAALQATLAQLPPGSSPICPGDCA